ncbi:MULTISPECIES: Bro-N domain-containing protein [Pseudomonadaceae]|uniref:Phage antirepressor n=1 Tax=Pseudomonas denitrificans TaxID=43306 RepID=A0A9X7MWH0_PSEDE|nr:MULTISPECIES: BRO family protein [Pseudomonadaceae]MBD9632891.1 phage antirepressor [Pseudomonas sp. PDM19]QEY70753.1 phage antirepressor [Pseudomonas denitrificans (nom. rej.)]
MQDAYRPVIFQRHTHQLRAILIDRQPWFVGLDFGRLIGTGRPYHLPKRMDPEQKRAVVLEYLSGFREEVEVISESGAYKALYRFWHPEHRHIAKWLSDEVLPTLHDTQHIPDTHPHRAFMTWADQRIGVIKWQGEIWIARRDLPTFLAAQDDWALRDAPSWRTI